jgi:hypothetical protein
LGYVALGKWQGEARERRLEDFLFKILTGYYGATLEKMVREVYLCVFDFNTQRNSKLKRGTQGST